MIFHLLGMADNRITRTVAQQESLEPANQREEINTIVIVNQETNSSSTSSSSAATTPTAQVPVTQALTSTSSNNNNNSTLSLGFNFNSMEDSTRIIANNLSSTIGEISPLINLSRSRPAISFQEWLNPSHHRHIQQLPPPPANEHSDSVVINVDVHASELNNENSQTTSDNNEHGNNTFGDNFSNNVQETDNPPSQNNNNSNAESNSAQSVPTTSEARTIQRTIDSYVPFLTILLTKAIYDNGAEIFNLLIVVATFIQANNDLKREILKQQNRSHMVLLGILCYIAGCFIFINFVMVFLFSQPTLLIYTPPVTITQLIWSVAVTDYMLKLVTVCVKVLVTCLPVWILPFQKRGKYYLVIESSSQLYRCGAPLKPWLWYLSSIYDGPDKMLGMVLFIIYGLHKLGDIMTHVKQFFHAVWKMLQDASLGVPPTKEQILASGGTCAICHEEYSMPVKLTCKHIFCEGCVATWLDRERSCPLCRASITDDPIYRDGHTTHFIQLY